MAHIDWRADAIERAIDCIDRANDAGAEAARLGEDQFHASHPPSSQDSIAALACSSRARKGAINEIYRSVQG